MNIPKLWSQSLEKQKDVKEIINQLLIQINKDFSFFGEEIRFSEKAKEAYQNLFDQIVNFISITYLHQLDKLYPVLYRIDISEKDIKKAINNHDFVGAIAELIILKELQKVIIRNYYKSKN